MYCPKCGHQINDSAGGWTGLKSLQQSTALTLPDQAEISPPGFSSAYRKTPFRKPEMIPDVWVPLAQSLVTGLLASVVFAVITPAFPGWTWYTGPVIGLVVVALAWIFLLWAGRGMLWVIEEITGMDINGDGDVGQPQKRVVEVAVKEGRSTRLAELPGDEAGLIRFCQWIAAGDSFSEKTAQSCGYGVTNFRKLRDIFISRRWGYWKNPDSPQQGVELTVGGQQIIRELAHSPTLPDGDLQTVTR